MAQLTEIRHHLAGLRIRLRTVRCGSALLRAVAAVLAALTVLFALDVWLHCSVAERVVLLALGLALAAWAVWRATRRLFGTQVGDLDLALRVENENGIDSDLVAALQFDEAPDPLRGSRQLQEAIIGRVAARWRSWDFLGGVDYRPLLASAVALAAASAVALLAVTIAPQHAAVFARRLFLSNRSYPTRTTIEAILVNGSAAYRRGADPDLQPQHIRCARNHTVRFLVHSSDVLPPSGLITCRPLESGDPQLLALDPVPASTGWYAAELPRMVETFQYHVVCGDAVTQAATVQMIELPVVELSLVVTPPDYARRTSPPRNASPLQTEVLDGSHVALQVRSANGKSLADVRVRLSVAGQETELKLARQDERGRIWQLPAENSPLAKVTHEIRYSIHVVDEDQLQPESPLRGEIRIRPDQPPTATAEVLHRLVLPNAEPVIQYRLRDDYGIASARILAEVQRPENDSAADLASPPIATRHFAIPLTPLPLAPERLPALGEFRLDLRGMQLTKGDRLKIVVEAVDFRGEQTGVVARSESRVLEISDEAGVLAAITAADERAERMLSDIIERQLDLGDGS